MKKRLSATLAKTRFKEVEMVAIAAKPGQEEGKAQGCFHDFEKKIKWFNFVFS